LRNPCSVCAHERREEIDRATLSSTPLREIASRFPGVSKSAIGRHRKHVAGAIVRATARIVSPPVEAAEIERFEDSILGEVARLKSDARRLFEKAEASGDIRGAVVAHKGLVDVMRFIQELTAGTTDTAAPVRVEFHFAGSAARQEETP